MIQIKGKYCKDCKIFTDNIEQEALSMVYRFLDHPMFEGSKVLRLGLCLMFIPVRI